MNKYLFSKLIKNSDHLDDKSLIQLKEIIDEYPFFQMGRMLMIKNLHKLDHIKFNSELKYSAAYIADRNKLYFLLHDLSSPLHVDNPELDNKPILPDVQNENVTEQKKNKEIPELLSNISEDDISVDQQKELAEPIPDEDVELKKEKKEDNILSSVDLLNYERNTSAAYSLAEPDDIEVDNRHSFSDWLQLMKNKRIEKERKEQTIDENEDLIANFLSVNPKIIPDKNKIKKIDLSERQNKGEEDIMSETLANIFIKQGHNNKAISILEKLLLKYPEKNAYFANRISELKENLIK